MTAYHTLPFVYLMKKSISLLSILFGLLLCGSSCKKDDEKPRGEVDPGDFNATIDGTAWKPAKHKAVYYPKWHQLYVSASDYTYTFTAGINIDSTTALKNYLLESHGDNEVELKTDTEQYNSDQNKADAGGHFSLTKFDTSAKLVSGGFQVVCYAADKTKKVIVSSTLTDLPLVIDTSGYNGSSAQCTVTGATTTEWRSKDFFAKVTCLTNGVDKTLELHISSILGSGAPNRRYLLLMIPLNNQTGIFPVYPDLPPYSYYCGSGQVLSRYNVNNYNDSYYTTSGSLNITGMDTAHKKLNANFDITFRDTTSRQETIRITNGRFNINNWEEM